MYAIFQGKIRWTLLMLVGLAVGLPSVLSCGDDRALHVLIFGSYLNDHDPQQNLGSYGGYCHVLLGPGSGETDGQGNLSGDAYLYAGKVYTLSYQAQDATSVSIILSAPTGYDLYINGVLQRTVSDGPLGGTGPLGMAIYSNQWQVEFRPKVCGGEPGYSPGLQVGDVVWEASLGRLINGDLAGKIVIHEDTFTTGLFSRTVLNCMATSSDMEVINLNGLRQVRTPETFVDIQDISGGFQLDFYSASAISGSSGGLYTTSGIPFISYAITNGGTSNRIQVVRSTAGNAPQNTLADYAVNNGLPVWQMSVAATRVENKTSVTDGNGDRVETTIVQDGAGIVASKTIRTYHMIGTEQLIKLQEDPDGKNYTTTWSYYNYTFGTGFSGMPHIITYPTGEWVAYDYYIDDLRRGQIFREYHPWLDNPGVTPDQANETNCHAITYDYVFGGNDSGPLVASRVERVMGTIVAQTSIANDFTSSAPNGAAVLIQSQVDSVSSGPSYATTTKTYRTTSSLGHEFQSDMIFSIQHPEGTMESYARVPGAYDTASHVFTPSSASSDLLEVVFNGVMPAVGAGVPGASVISTFAGTTIDPVSLIPGKSTARLTIRKAGLIVREETYAFTAGATFDFAAWGANLVTWANYTYTASGKLTQKVSSNGSIHEAAYSDEFKISETDETGIIMTYWPDALLRVAGATKSPGNGYAGATVPTSGITTQFFYDAESNLVKAITLNGGMTLTTLASYNPGGRLTSRTAPSTATQPYTTLYDDAQGGLVQTIAYPGGATQITTNYPDGQLASVTGTAQVASFYTYSVDGTGVRAVMRRNGNSSSGDWTLQQSDWSGRKLLDQHPDANGAAVTTAYSYNALGELTKATTTGTGATVAPTLYAYDIMAAQTTTALDLNYNNVIDLAGPDRVSSTTSNFAYAAGAWWQTTHQSVYADASGVPTPSLTTDVKLSGFTGNDRAETHVTDINNNITVQVTTMDSTNRVVTKTTSMADSNILAQDVSYNGYSVLSTSIHGVTTRFDYDALGRIAKTRDPRKGGVVTQYVPLTNQVFKTSYDGGPDITAYSYGADGRISATQDAGSHVTYVAYNSRGELTNQWGDAINPVKYDYDSFGRLVYESTYRSGSGWANNDWSTIVTGPADVTTFVYYADLPLLQAKKDPSLNLTTLIYDAFGHIVQRINARGQITTNTYDPGSGDLMQIAYNDGVTPQVNYTYARTGAVANVTDVTGLRAFVPNANLQVSAEQLSSFYGPGRQISYEYATSGVIGRLDAVNLGTSSNHTADQATGYTYKTDGRLDIASGRGPSASYASYNFTYDYVANADTLIASVTNGGTGYVQSRDYNATRDLLKTFATKYGTATLTQYDYTFNSLGQRDTALQSGTAYQADYGNSTYYKYTYDGKGQLFYAYGYLGSNVSGSTDPVMSGRSYQYTYDNAGNRTSVNSTQVTGLLENFVPNSLNQISSRDYHTVSVQGTSISDPTLTVAVSADAGSGQVSNSAGRTGRYWGGVAVLNNSQYPKYQPVTITATLPQSGSTLVRQDSKNAFLAADPQTLTYDADGNLTNDGQWSYAYDAENRLTQMTTTALAAAAGTSAPAPNVKLTFKYDYLGRRVSRKIEDYVSGAWTLREELRFVYNSWNLLAEMTTSGVIQRYFTWGLDLSGSANAMGGIGALLMVQDSGHTYFPAYDGQGNVAAMLDAADGSVAALYEYNPFGGLLRSEKAYASTNRFRFSTKFTDNDTGLSYYGLRYYSASLGRFISHDPIGEAGGMNLYGFAHNDPVNGWDLLGMTDQDDAVVMAKFVVNGSGLESSDSFAPTSVDPSSVHIVFPTDPRVLIPADINSKFEKNGKDVGKKFKECMALADAIEKLTSQIKDAIADFSNINKFFKDAVSNARLALTIKLATAAVGLVRLATDLVANATATAVETIEATSTSLPGVVTASGRIVSVGNPQFGAVVGARTAGAISIGAHHAAEEVVGHAVERTLSHTSERVFDPFNAAANAGIEAGNDASQIQAATVTFMQGTLTSLKDQQRRDCGPVK